MRVRARKVDRKVKWGKNEEGAGGARERRGETSIERRLSKNNEEKKELEREKRWRGRARAQGGRERQESFNFNLNSPYVTSDPVNAFANFIPLSHSRAPLTLSLSWHYSVNAFLPPPPLYAPTYIPAKKRI